LRVPARDLLDYELAEAPPVHAAQLMTQAHDLGVVVLATKGKPGFQRVRQEFLADGWLGMSLGCFIPVPGEFDPLPGFGIGLSIEIALRLLRSRQIPGFRVGGDWRFDSENIDALGSRGRAKRQ
jgi:hypothetical protein